MHLNDRNFHIVCAFTVYSTCFKLMWIRQCLLEIQSKYTLLWIIYLHAMAVTQVYGKTLSYSLKQHPKTPTNYPLLPHLQKPSLANPISSQPHHAIHQGPEVDFLLLH